MTDQILKRTPTDARAALDAVKDQLSALQRENAALRKALQDISDGMGEISLIEIGRHSPAVAGNALKRAARFLEALTDEPQDAAPITPEAREDIVDTVEEIISETHDLDVRDRHYAENVVSWLERHHPAALRAIAEATPK